jgi:hypothetical protein
MTLDEGDIQRIARSSGPARRSALSALVVHVVTKDSPGPGVLSPTAVRADLPPLPLKRRSAGGKA